ncbi:MAG: hypothetical protein NT056_06035 [Proteobacteria bacterium]|nr:hypothetical protein [Pseudomonadota bacterium]
MDHVDNKITGAGAEEKTESPERRKFLQRFLGIGILSVFFLPGRPGTRPFSPFFSKKADFWRKGDRMAG